MYRFMVIYNNFLNIRNTLLVDIYIFFQPCFVIERKSGSYTVEIW